MNEAQVLEHVARCLPAFAATGAPLRLSGGNLNWVWRIPAAPQSLIVKAVPPQVASAPDIALSSSRMMFEAQALRLFHREGRLERLATPLLRPPHLIDADAAARVLILEDFGAGPDLSQAGEDAALPERAARLAQFIADLHQTTFGDAVLAGTFRNLDVQETRAAVQYRKIGEMLGTADVEDAVQLDARASDLGERLLRPGRCLIMGDLWPRSVLIRGAAAHLIDWEFCHYGNPAQDVGHMAAHLWMLAHRASSNTTRRRWTAALTSFLAHYQRATAHAPALVDAAVAQDISIHLGCEILARTLGPFQSGYLYQGLDVRSAPITEAVAMAAQRLREPSTEEFLR